MINLILNSASLQIRDDHLFLQNLFMEIETKRW